MVGYRKQFPWLIAMDVGYINRAYKHMWAEVDINGIYPDGPGLPFGGFGRIDPNRGMIMQQTTNTWSQLKYQALEVTVAKTMSHGFQFMAGLNRQWHRMTGTWNPTDRRDSCNRTTSPTMPTSSCRAATTTTTHCPIRAMC